MGHLQHISPEVRPLSVQALRFFLGSNILSLSAQSPKQACLHSCRCHHMSAGNIHIDFCIAKLLEAKVQEHDRRFTCRSELALEATSKTWLTSSTCCKFSMTTSQLLALPNRPFAITMRCLCSLVPGACCVSGRNSCMVEVNVNCRCSILLATCSVFLALCRLK